MSDMYGRPSISRANPYVLNYIDTLLDMKPSRLVSYTNTLYSQRYAQIKMHW